ncbi:MAG: universal stress protein [Candidatus Eiseniibacteriota bacterium]
MKSILIPFEESDGLPSILETAYLAAARFGSYVEGLHVRPTLPAIAVDPAFAATDALTESFERQNQERARRARQKFEDFLRAKGLPHGEVTQRSDKPSAAWVEEASPGDSVVGHRGRLFDLIVVGRPVRGAPAPSMSTLEAALFDSGRPILVAPPTPPKIMGETLVIAWNGSTETARTIAFAMPFLQQAKRVSVLTIEDGLLPGPTGAEVARHLMPDGIMAEVVVKPLGGRTIGEAILAEAAALGCDLLVKGGYTQGRLRQLIFGGATSHILAAAEIPVIMAH